MLLSIISSSAISSSAISMITSPGLPQYGAAVVVGLICLLSLKEVLSASKHWNRSLDSSFNLATLPLLFSFAAIVIFKIANIIWIPGTRNFPCLFATTIQNLCISAYIFLHIIFYNHLLFLWVNPAFLIVFNYSQYGNLHIRCCPKIM